MNALQDRRVLPLVGGVVIILLAVLLALFMLRQHKPKAAQADAATAGALQVDVGAQDAKVSQTKPLRCFVGGQFVGLFTVQDCAARNGVAAQALDVGLDPATGQVAASTGSATPLQPLAPPVASSLDPASLPPAPKPTAALAAAATQAQSAAATGDCLRFAGEWRTVGGVMPLGQCVRTLFDGRCIRPGDALYGRWNGQTVRLLPGRVEISGDNRNFRTLVQQDADDCSLPAG